MERVMSQGRIFRLTVALGLIAAAAMVAVPPASYAEQVVLKSAHFDVDNGVLVLRGEFGNQPLTVSLADPQLQLPQQSADQLVVTVASNVQVGSYLVIVTSSAD